MAGCIIVSGAANRRRGRTSIQGDFLIRRLQEWADKNSTLARGTVVVFVSGNSFFGEDSTEAQSLQRRARGLGLGERFKELVCLDPMNYADQQLVQGFYELLDRTDPMLPITECSHNTYEGMLRAVDYCRTCGFTCITTLANPIHNTWAWPLLRQALEQGQTKPTMLGLMNSRQPWWRYSLLSPQWRLKAWPLFWLWGALGKAAQIKNGWILPRYV